MGKWDALYGFWFGELSEELEKCGSFGSLEAQKLIENWLHFFRRTTIEHWRGVMMIGGQVCEGVSH